MSRSPEAQAVVRELPIRPAAVERPVPDVPRPIDAALFERPVIAATAVQRVQRERQRPVYCERWASHAEWQAANVNAVTSVLHRSRRHFCLAALATSLPWRAWAGFNFWNSEYTVTRSELQAMIATRFPLSQRYAQIVTVELSEPQLALNAAANRAAITAHVSIASPLLRAGQVNGTVTLSSALRYGAAMRALLLEQPKAERLQLQGISGGDAEKLRQIGGLVAQELLQGQVLRTFTAEELSFGRKTYEIGDITILDDGIKVELK